MEFKKISANGADFYIGKKGDVRALLKSFRRRGIATSMHRRFPRFSPQKKVYALRVEKGEMRIIDAESIVLELLLKRSTKAYFEEYGGIDIIKKPTSIFDKVIDKCTDSKGKHYFILRGAKENAYCITPLNFSRSMRRGNKVTRENYISGEGVHPMELFEEGKNILDDSDVDF